MKVPILPDRESRFLTASVEFRDAQSETETPKVFGYAAKFNTRSQNLGSADYQFYEVLEAGAFDGVLKDDVRALFNHDSSAILARSKNGAGSLEIGVDAIGLWYRFEAPDTQVGRDLVTSLKRGDVDQSSFSFTVDKDGQAWSETKDGDGPTVFVRTISKVSALYDVSPVTYPAYLDATVALRSLEEFRKETPDVPEPIEDHSVSLWERRLALISKPPTA